LELTDGLFVRHNVNRFNDLATAKLSVVWSALHFAREFRNVRAAQIRRHNVPFKA
jgi:hypothetical protein